MITTAMMNGYGAPGGHTDIPTFTGMMILHVSFHCLPGMHETCFNHGTFFIPNLFLLSLLQHKKRGISWATFMKVVSQSFLIPKATVDHHLPDPLVEHCCHKWLPPLCHRTCLVRLVVLTVVGTNASYGFMRQLHLHPIVGDD